MQRHAQWREVLHITREQRETVMRRRCCDDDICKARRATERTGSIGKRSGHACDFNIKGKHAGAVEVQQRFEPGVQIVRFAVSAFPP